MLTIKLPNLCTGDARKLSLPRNSVNLIITHPPYFQLETSRYGGNPAKQITTATLRRVFIKEMVKAVKEMERVLTVDGSIWISIGARDGVDFSIISEILKHTSLQIAGSFIHKYYTPDDAFEYVRADLISTWVHLVKSPYFYSNPFICKRYSDPVWELPFNNRLDPVDQELSKEFFVEDVINKEIPSRLIQMYSKKEHMVLDPFGGSGIVAVTAASLGRASTSVDVSDDQLIAARARTRLTLENNENSSLHNRKE